VKVKLQTKSEQEIQRILNSKGDIYYGMHFYPGVAEYSEPGKDPFRIFVNEDTIRKMNPTFAGRPVFVEHVDEVSENVDDLRSGADGWVVESFFNEADGKHWAKFIIVSERAKRAIQKGYRLSNAYIPQGPFGPGGLWNGVTYAKQVLGGEYEHLAIVKNPRYEESTIMTPDQFKNYCEEQKSELKRLANSNQNEKENTEMKLNFFKKKVEKVENSSDLEGLSVTLPKSGKEKTIVQLVTEVDARAVLNGYANEEDKVKIGENEMSVKDLVANYGKMCSELEDLKKAKNEDADVEDEVENEDDVENEDSEAEAKEDAKDAEPEMQNEDDEAEAKKDAKKAEKEMGDKKSNSKSKGDKKHFDKLKNAHRAQIETVKIDLIDDQLARGKQRYGSSH